MEHGLEKNRGGAGGFGGFGGAGGPGVSGIGGRDLLVADEKRAAARDDGDHDHDHDHDGDVDVDAAADTEDARTVMAEDDGAAVRPDRVRDPIVGPGGAPSDGTGAAGAAGAAVPTDRSRSEKDPFEVAWDGGDADPACPRSMGLGRRWLIVSITAFGAVCVTCASSIYTATYRRMDAEFGCSTLVATLGLSMFVLGIAMGPAWSPLSEVYGRRPVYLGSFFSFMVWIVPSAVAQNIQTMLVARFFQGLAGSAFLSVAGGTVNDLFTREAMHWPMAVFSGAPFLGPSLGPLIGGFINSHVDWRWTHYVLLVWSFCLLVALLLLVPETHHPVLLRTKARRLRAATGDDRWHAPLEREAAAQPLPRTVGLALLRPFHLLVSEPMCLVLDLYSAVVLGVLYLFFGAFPLVFETNHGFTLWQTGLAFLGLFVGILVGGATSGVWGSVRTRLIARRQRLSGSPVPVSEPEDRLPPVMAGAVLIPIGLFWFGWASGPNVHWIVPILGSGVFAVGTVWSFSGVFTFFVDAYPLYAASALAGNAFVRCSSAAAFPLFGVQMYHRLGDQWATSLLAFLTVGLLPFPFLFFKYGKALRGRSRFAVS